MCSLEHSWVVLETIRLYNLYYFKVPHQAVTKFPQHAISYLLCVHAWRDSATTYLPRVLLFWCYNYNSHKVIVMIVERESEREWKKKLSGMTTPPTMFRADSDRRTCFESNSRSSLPGMSHEVDRIEGYLSTKGKKTNLTIQLKTLHTCLSLLSLSKLLCPFLLFATQFAHWDFFSFFFFAHSLEDNNNLLILFIAGMTDQQGELLVGSVERAIIFAFPPSSVKICTVQFLFNAFTILEYQITNRAALESIWNWKIELILKWRYSHYLVIAQPGKLISENND